MYSIILEAAKQKTYVAWSEFAALWALGEAVVDAVATRYPAAFDRQVIEGVE